MLGRWEHLLIILVFVGGRFVDAQDLFLSFNHQPMSPQPETSRVVSDHVAVRLNLSEKQREAADVLLDSISKSMNNVVSRWTNLTHAGQAPLLNRTMLPTGEGNSRCMDGSPYGFYFRPAPASSAHKKDWVMFLQGGGLCITISDCWARARSMHGSSKAWPETYSVDDNIISPNSTINPFWDFNHVWLPYCTGDTHTGVQTERNAYGLYFAGALNLEASVNYLQSNYGLGSASQVILGGGSAGGIGTHNNVDWLQSALPGARVMGLPMAGQFFPKHIELSETQVLRVLHILRPVVEINSLLSMVVTELYQSRLPLPCSNSSSPAAAYRCWDAGYNYDYILAPMLYAQNMFDQYQIERIMLCVDCPTWAKEYIAYFGMETRKTLGAPPQFSHRRNSVWMPACYYHTETLCFASEVEVSGQRLDETARDWFFNGVDETKIDACATSDHSQPCNSRCNIVHCTDM